MDHVLNSIEAHYEPYLDQFIDYHRTGEYKKLSDNPMYEEVKAIIDSMNCIRKYLGWENIRLSEEVKEIIGEWGE